MEYEKLQIKTDDGDKIKSVGVRKEVEEIVIDWQRKLEKIGSTDA